MQKIYISHSIHFYIFESIANLLQIARKFIFRDYHRRAVVVRMEAVKIVFLQICIEEKMNMILCIVYKAERRHRAGSDSQILFHTRGRSKRQLTLMQTLLKVVNIEVLLAIEHHKIVAVALFATSQWGSEYRPKKTN